MRALMEMKHLGSTLRATVYTPSPQVLGLTERSREPLACLCEHKCVCVCVYRVYMKGWDPWGSSAMSR